MVNQDDSHGCGKKWLDSENIQKGKSTRFPNRLDVGVRKRRVKNVLMVLA